MNRLYLVDGSAVRELLEQTLREPLAFRRIIVCSPFIEGAGIDFLQQLYHASQRIGGPMVRVITSPRTAGTLKYSFGSRSPQFLVRERPYLHAKIYLRRGRNPLRDAAIVTSANFTTAGLYDNDEIGVSMLGFKNEMRPFIDQLANHTFLR